jgi:ATP-dependent DNA helicase RecG
VTLLTGSMGAVARRRALLEAASGGAGIVIGTHALLEEKVQFADLGLVVVDEQHRFGVEQRDALRDKAGDGRPHVLVMTATPIPRTVAMTVFGDLDTSTLTELPAGRAPIQTHVVPTAERPHYLARTWERIREEVTAGRQAYVVCPRIGDEAAAGGDAGQDGPAGQGGPAGRGQLRAAGRGTAGDDGEEAAGFRTGDGEESTGEDSAGEDGAGEEGAGVDGDGTPARPPIAVLDLAAQLAAAELAGLRIGILHGRLPPEEKDRVMLAFADGTVDVLVTTTVVEVGVDVPNATVMAIMDADRFGVSQLHQLRGRVGRGAHGGLCLLVTEAPEGSPARERLTAVASTTDGFVLSRIDLAQRREGDVLGTAQAGRRSSLRLLRLLEDEDLIGQARQEAGELVEADPELAGEPGLAAVVAELADHERAAFLEKA